MPAMRSMLNRIRRLEAAGVPEEQERAAVEAIRDWIMAGREGRKRPDLADLPPWPVSSARELGEAIVQARRRLQRESAEREAKQAQDTPE